MTKRYVGYVRVSDTRGREDTLISDKVQRADIEAYAQLLKGEVTAWREDLDRSGTKLKHRESFIDAVEMVERGDVDGLIVARLNRFARNAADATAIANRIELAGGEFVSAHERLDNGPYGRFTRTIFFAMGELEADVIRENWAVAQANALGEGRSVTPWAAAGFEFERRGKQRFLVPHRAYAPLVAEAFERRARGDDVADVARFLREHEVPNSRGRSVWTTAETSRLLKRRIYIGELRHGDTVFLHEDLAIVDANVFRQAQNMRRPAPVRNTGSGYLLSGVARCAGCGYAMRGHKASAAMVRNGSRPDYYYYRCAGHHSGGDCPAVANASGEKLDDFAVDRLWAFMGDRQAKRASPGVEREDAVKVRDTARAELGAYVAMQSALGEHYLSGFERRAEAVRDAEATVAALNVRMNVSLLPPIADLRVEWDHWTLDERRGFLAEVMPCVWVRRMPRLTLIEHRALAVPRDEMQTIDLPDRSSSARLRPFAWGDGP